MKTVVFDEFKFATFVILLLLPLHEMKAVPRSAERPMCSYEDSHSNLLVSKLVNDADLVILGQVMKSQLLKREGAANGRMRIKIFDTYKGSSARAIEIVFTKPNCTNKDCGGDGINPGADQYLFFLKKVGGRTYHRLECYPTLATGHLEGNNLRIGKEEVPLSRLADFLHLQAPRVRLLPKSPFHQSPEWFECKKDSECVLDRGGCYEPAAINRVYIKDWQDLMARERPLIDCAQLGEFLSQDFKVGCSPVKKKCYVKISKKPEGAWFACKSDNDCSVTLDPCHQKRVSVSRKSFMDYLGWAGLMAQQLNCPSDAQIKLSQDKRSFKEVCLLNQCELKTENKN